MKKILEFTLSVVMIITLAGCSKKEVPEIEENLWVMTTVQSNEKEGQVIAYGPDGSSQSDNAVKIDLECKAEDGELTLIDKTNDKTYTGIYVEESTSSESTIYEITVGETEGMAVASMTTYDDNSQRATLILSLEDFALNFCSLDK